MTAIFVNQGARPRPAGAVERNSEGIEQLSITVGSDDHTGQPALDERTHTHTLTPDQLTKPITVMK